MDTCFAYGSNLGTAQIRRHAASARFCTRASLPGFRMVFPLVGEDWQGGVAGLQPYPTSRVEGVLYDIAAEDWPRLDDYEGRDEGDYYREKMPGVLPDGSTREAWIYFAVARGTGACAPSAAYMAAVIAGAQEHRLPAEYIRSLRAIQTA